MKCLRCGYCCKQYMVIIVDNPEKGVDENNLIAKLGNGEPCQHLRGEKPGEYSCIVHNESWYKMTPCFTHGQIETDPEEECRIGKYILRNIKIILPE